MYRAHLDSISCRPLLAMTQNDYFPDKSEREASIVTQIWSQ